MHIHVARVRRNGKTYEYVQLVESYRRKDGMPTQRVLATLGAMPPLAIENLRIALRANKEAQCVVVSDRPLAREARPPRPVQNLRYLDLAVLMELWSELGVGNLLAELMPPGQAEVAPADVVAALVLQRCVDPGSKLYAQRWFPRTALPELLGIASDAFNNTRLHRVLDLLDTIADRLMARLPDLYEQCEGALTTLFLDMTDTWFVGEGPDLAERAKTKEGLVTQKVGIALLCNERGYPLRWKVVAGKHAEISAMHQVVRSVAGLRWVDGKPLVMDRAMGVSAQIRKLLSLGVYFVTALRSDEFAAYTDRVPYQTLTDLAGEPEAVVTQAAQRMAAAGMERVSDTMYVLDLGVVERDAAIEPELCPAAGQDLASFALTMVRQLEQMVQSKQAESIASAGRRLGLSRHLVKWYRPLLLLAPDLQEKLLEGQAAGLSITQLVKIARLKDHEQQRSEFTQLLAKAPKRSNAADASKLSSAKEPSEPPPALRVRAVVNFNPQRFATERRHAQEDLDQVQHRVAALNVRLAKSNQRKPQSIERELEDMLRRRNLLNAYTIAVEECTLDNKKCLQARVTLDVNEWQQRRRYDGFFIIVTHPDLKMTAADVSRLYREKDAVEKDFQVIKSFVQLRPVWHRTDAKVRAHVTVCMLALLLERVLAHRLTSTTSSRALELLASCNLNRFADALYVLTQPDAEQRALLQELGLERLADDLDLAARIRPRPSDRVAST